MDSTRLYMSSVWYRKFIDSLAGLYFRGDRGDMRPADPNWVEKISPGTFEFRKQSVEQGTYLVAVCSKEPA
jgi:hypothetical protein